MSAEHDIYRSLRLNRVIVIGVLIIASGISVSAMVFAYSVYRHNMDHALVLSGDGEVIPLQWVERQKVIDIQLRDHLDTWFDSYYTFDQNDMIDQREKGLWLIATDDGKKLEEFYENKGWYNDIIRQGLGQRASVIPESIELAGNDEPYSFKCSVLIEVFPLTRRDLKDSYRMNAVGQMSFVEPNWPVNVHGILIHNYRESPWIKIEQE